MGSIPVKFRPLSNRINIIVSRRLQQSDAGSLGIDEKQDSYLVDSIDSACLLIRKLDHPHDINPQTGVQSIINKVFVIGGLRSIDPYSTNNLLIFKAPELV
ncbi:hypothetical protein H4Q26_014732 [Puccinia striiformis f. sp. tritici PST-130]|nr:hypothetical protein H4Q26_014732 [Puccinia striiformis f. sp. tritici PST-130]